MSTYRTYQNLSEALGEGLNENNARVVLVMFYYWPSLSARLFGAESYASLRSVVQDEKPLPEGTLAQAERGTAPVKLVESKDEAEHVLEVLREAPAAFKAFAKADPQVRVWTQKVRRMAEETSADSVLGLGALLPTKGQIEDLSQEEAVDALNALKTNLQDTRLMIMSSVMAAEEYKALKRKAGVKYDALLDALFSPVGKGAAEETSYITYVFGAAGLAAAALIGYAAVRNNQ